MNDKEKQIEEMAKELDITYTGAEEILIYLHKKGWIKPNKDIYNEGYRKIPKDAVVLTKVEYESLIQSLTQTTVRECELADRARALLHECDVLKIDLDKARKKTAKEILQAVDRESNGQTISITNYLRKKYAVEVEE